MYKNKIIELSNKFEKDIIKVRREIHKNPELAFEEYKTSKLIADELKKLGIEVKENIGKTGVLGILEGKKKVKDPKVILLRADMDALPIEENTDLAYSSTNKGVMHACGHDIHTSNLLGVAMILSNMREHFGGTIKFMFQPAEEKGGGAREMVKEGILKNPEVDLALGIHVGVMPEGTILLGRGVVTGSTDGFFLHVYGKGGHTSNPKEGIDAIGIAANIINSINSIGIKELDPLKNRATYSIGTIKGGTAANVIPDFVEMEGMVRTLDDESRDTLLNRIKEMAENIARAYGGRTEFILIEGYPFIENDVEISMAAEKILKENIELLSDGLEYEIDANNIHGEREVFLTADDFGFVSKEVPSLYYVVGVGQLGGELHTDKFVANEDMIKYAMRSLSLLTLEFLNE